MDGGGTQIRTGDKGFADLCLTTWLCRPKTWSGKRDSNPRPPPWQGGALPLSYFRMMAGLAGFEPAHHGVKVRCLTAWLQPNEVWGDRWESNPRMPEPQSGALTTSPRSPFCLDGRGSRNRTRIDGFGDRCSTIELCP